MVWTHSSKEWWRDPCPLCDKPVIISEPSAMCRHMVEEHSHRLKWECTYVNNCKARMDSVANMREHVYTHTGALPYKCHVWGCGRRFDRKSYLLNHANRCHMYETHIWELTPRQQKEVDVEENRAHRYIKHLLLRIDGLCEATNSIDAAKARYHAAESAHNVSKAEFDEARMGLDDASAACSTTTASRDAIYSQNGLLPQLTTQPRHFTAPQPRQSPRPSKRLNLNEVSQNKPHLAPTTETSTHPNTQLPNIRSVMSSIGTLVVAPQGFPFAMWKEDVSGQPIPTGNGTPAAGYPGWPQNRSFAPVLSGNGTSAVGSTEQARESATLTTAGSRYHDASHSSQMRREPMYSSTTQEETISRPDMNKLPPLRGTFRNGEMEGNGYSDTDTMDWDSY